jgi:hypothetical protein
MARCLLVSYAIDASRVALHDCVLDPDLLQASYRSQTRLTHTQRAPKCAAGHSTA